MNTSGDKLRVGLILPALQVVTEPLYYQVAGEDFDYFTTRIYLGGTDVDDYKEMDKSLPRAVRELETAEVDIIAYCCTASGAISGYEEENDQCRAFEIETKIPMTTTMTSVVDALRLVDAKRIVLVSPYHEEINQTENDYFMRNGIEVIKDAGQGITVGSQMSKVTPEQIVDFALEHWDDSADALFMSCMNWQAMRAVAVVESRINKPVITSHSATLWKITSLANKHLRMPEYGKRLFSETRI